MTTDKNPTDKQTPLEGISRRTGQQPRDSKGDEREGAKTEAPSNKNEKVPGSPNQGTDSR
ncbi:MAG: hypothetical protein ACTS2F_20095 [Thainema sp.]